MQPLQPLQYHEPASLAEAAELLARIGVECRVLGGGTDLVPSMRQGLLGPSHLLSLQAIPALHRIEWDESAGLRIGASATLHEVASHREVLARFGIVAEGAFEVGSPTIRRMATVGGNLCLDTRCYYYNQSETWRSCTEPCLKLGGEFCKASPGGNARKCFAAFSADLAPTLVALGAQVSLVSAAGQRQVSMREFYTHDGAQPNVKRADEILTEVLIPRGALGSIGCYRKYRIRDSIDYPIASVALVMRPTADAGVFDQVCLVVGAVNTGPVIVPGVADRLDGQPLDEAAIEFAVLAARKAAMPQANTAGTRGHRKTITAELTRQAFTDLLRRAWR